MTIQCNINVCEFSIIAKHGYSSSKWFVYHKILMLPYAIEYNFAVHLLSDEESKR